MKEYGNKQGDMSPSVMDYQKPAKDYSQEGFGKTNQYISRQDATVAKQASKVKSQGYSGRYS